MRADESGLGGSTPPRPRKTAQTQRERSAIVRRPQPVRLAELAGEINAHHEAAEHAIGRALEHARRCGELLIQAKAHVRHGEFQGWIEQHFAGSYRTAAIYMRISKRWSELEAKSAGSSALSIDGAIKLLAVPKPAALEPEEQDQLERCEAVIQENIAEVHRVLELSDLLCDQLQLAGLTFPPRGETILGAGDDGVIEITNAGPVERQGDDHYHVARMQTATSPDNDCGDKPVLWRPR